MNEMNSCEAMAQSSPKPKIRLEIQGLRGVSILAVLLFHLWPRRFPHGYLGVDVFFVISGFLMASLLDAKKPLDWAATQQFYFRRIKRIIPTYLFVILAVLLLAVFFLSPTDTRDLRLEATKPLLFVANRPNAAKDDYFAPMYKKYTFFEHLWSLSVELQFYLLVPLLVFFLHRTFVGVQLMTITLLAALSFFIQINSKGDFEHMWLEGRLWQFMAGFAALYLPRAISRQYTTQEDDKTEQSNFPSCRWWAVARTLASYLLSFGLVFILYRTFDLPKVVNRLLVVGVTGVFIGLAAPSYLLSNPLVVALGDVSFSVYLVHFPLFKCYDYWFVAPLSDRNVPLVEESVTLMLVAVVVGCAVEDLFRRLNSLLTTWTRLLLLVLALYAAIGCTLVLIERTEMKGLDASSDEMLENAAGLMRAAAGFYEKSRRNLPLALSKKEVVEYNRLFFPAACQLHWYCGQHAHLPTTYRHKRKMGALLKDGCTIERPGGKKNIVVIGNSHAPPLVAGIRHHFRDVFRTITPVYRHRCQFVGATEQDVQYAHCHRERNALLPLLRRWKYPIHVIVVAIAYASADPPLRSANLTEDPVFREMQAFFSELNKIAREIVLFSQVRIKTEIFPYAKVLQRQLMAGESLDNFRIPYEFVASQKRYNRRRLAAVRCPKCLLFNYMDVFCNKTEGFCSTVDLSNGLSFTSDQHHPSLYGSFFIGEHLRALYDQRTHEKEAVH